MKTNRFACGSAVALLVFVPVIAAGAAPATSTPAPVATSTPGGAPSPAQTVLVPRGTPVLVKTIAGYSSYAAHTGEKLTYELVNDVIVKGFMVAKAGDDVEGQVEEAQQGRSPGYWRAGKAADLRVSVDALHNFCGDTIHLRFDRTEYRRRQGLFGSNRDVQVVKGQEYVPVVAYPQKVCGVPTTATPAPLPSDAIRSANH